VSWQPDPGHWQQTFTIIPIGANQLIESIHDRMRAILDERTPEDG
jgi:putative SOS response-associated peptidase YedK